MKATAILCSLLLALLVVACSSGAVPAKDKAAETAAVLLPKAASEQSSPTDLAAPEKPAEATSQPVVESPNCASPEANQLGAAIAKDYAFTSTDQVMMWFCNGAEFEDILVALETADQTGASAEEMLKMLAAGMTWEEIWQVVGLTD